MLKRLLFSALFTVAAAASAAPAKGKTEWIVRSGGCELVARTSAPGAVAKVGERVKISLCVKSENPGRFQVAFYENGNPVGAPRDCKFGETATLEHLTTVPGSVFGRATAFDAAGKPILNSRRRRLEFGLGVLVSPEKIAPGNPQPPPDFDAFWTLKRAELDKVPIKATRRELPLSEAHRDLVCYDTQVDCAGGAPVSGYLCLPRGAKPKSLPAIAIFHGAGVRSSIPPVQYGSRAIAFNVNAHGLPNGRPKKYYDDLFAGELADYRTRHLDDHTKNYFVGMYMRIMRALDYLKSLPEWDGRTLIVTGGSQGGAQALAAAGLDPQVSLCVAGVPSMCDLGGRMAGRQPGGPIRRIPEARQRDPLIVRETAYVDNAFLAKNVKCPVYLSAGLIDRTCYAVSIYAVYNRLPEDLRHIAINPTGGHSNSPAVAGRRKIKEVLKLGKE